MTLAASQPRVLADIVPGTWVRNAALVVGGAGFVALCAQITFFLPWNPVVPLTLQTFAVVLSAAALGSWLGMGAMVLYALIGSLGAPVFAQASSGFGGPTFGYIIGFIVAAFVVGRVAEMGNTRNYVKMIGLMILGNVIIYVIGMAWLKYSLSIPWFGADSAWAYGAQDFIVGDLIKIALAAGLLPLTWRGLRKAGLTD